MLASLADGDKHGYAMMEDIQRFADVRLGPGTLYDWLRERPVIAMPGYSFLVYDITGDADAHARLAQLYLESHLRLLAAAEARRALALDPGDVLARAIMQRLAGP